jgi:hypothetical protein
MTIAYSELTDEQKSVLQSYVQFLRGWCGEQAKTSNHGAVLQEVYNAQAAPILALLAGTEVVPNQSNLDGAESLTSTQIANLNNYSLLTQTYNTTAHRGQMAKACGGVNLIG